MIPKPLLIVVCGALSLSFSLANTSAVSLSIPPNSLVPHWSKSLIKEQGTHTFADLNRFHLSATHFTQGSLQQALDVVVEKYRETCRLTKQQPIPIRYTGTGSKSRTLNVTLSGTFTEVSNLIAAYYGCKLEYTPNNHTLTSRPLTTDSTHTVKEIALPPNWSKKLHIEASEGKALDKLATLLDVGDDTKLDLSSAKNSLSINGSPLVIAKVQSIADILKKSVPKQIRISTKFVGLPTESDALASILTGEKLLHLDDGQLQMTMRGLSQIQGTTIASAPSIILRNQELGQVEVVKEFETGLFSSKKQWTGLRMHAYGELCGLDVAINRDVFIGQREGVFKKIHYYDYRYLSRSLDGKSTARYSHSHDGTNYYIFMTSNIVDATGKSIR